MYGAVKKKGGYPALPGMAFESLLTGLIGAVALIVGAAAPWIWQLVPATPDPMAVTGPAADMALLAGCGVLTAIPLLLFSAAANRISLTVIGFIQYVSPTIALVLAVAFFGEQFTMAHGICFALIWLGIAAIGAEAAWTGRRKPVSYTHLDVYKRQGRVRFPGVIAPEEPPLSNMVELYALPAQMVFDAYLAGNALDNDELLTVIG